MKQLVSYTTKPTPVSSSSSSSKTVTRPTTSPRRLVSIVGCLLVATLMLVCLAVGPTQQQPTTVAGAAGATGSRQPAPGSGEGKGIFKRSFAGLGCLGVYDKAKFARLDRVCEECYQLYREPDIHMACRQDCFRNSVFTRCVDALLLSHEQKKFDEMVDELYGK